MGIDQVGGAGPNRPIRPAARRAESGFSVQVEASASSAGEAAAIAPPLAAALGCVLSAQEAGVEAAADREARQRGRDLLRTLSDLQRALLAGGPDPGILRRLVDLVDGVPGARDAALGATVRAIALRARVELARNGL